MTTLSATLRPYRMHVAVVVANATFAAIFVTIALSGFHQPTPHGLPVAVVAPARVARQISQGLVLHAPRTLKLRRVSTAAQARVAIAHHDVDAALVARGGRLTLLTAAAGGTAPTQAITAAVTALAAQSHEPLTTTDVVPPHPDDSQALSSFFLILCTLFPSLGTGLAAGHALRRSPLAARMGVLVAVAGIVGLAAAAIGDGISGLGHYWAIAGIVALFSLAISAPTAALGQVRPHLAALCVLTFLVVGIPASGGPANLAAFGPSFLRSLTEVLPLGVAANTSRDTVYFGAAHTAGHLLVLAAYVAGGVAALSLLARLRRPSRRAHA